MAHRKQVPQLRTCAQCATVSLTAHKGHIHCSSACGTRALRAGKPTKASTTSLAALPPASSLAPSPVARAVSVALSTQSVGTVAVGTVVGNALMAVLANLFARPDKPAPSRHQPFPTWPPPASRAGARTRPGGAGAGVCPRPIMSTRSTSMPKRGCPMCSGSSRQASGACWPRRRT